VRRVISSHCAPTVFAVYWTFVSRFREWTVFAISDKATFGRKRDRWETTDSKRIMKITTSATLADKEWKKQKTQTKETQRNLVLISVSVTWFSVTVQWQDFFTEVVLWVSQHPFLECHFVFASVVEEVRKVVEVSASGVSYDFFQRKLESMARGARNCSLSRERELFVCVSLSLF
jgi:hypothetical protein